MSTIARQNNFRLHCPNRQTLRENLTKLISLRDQQIIDNERNKIIFNIAKNLEAFTVKTFDNSYCKPAFSNVNQHFNKLIAHLTHIMTTINNSAEEFKTINIIKASEYANLIELNVAEFIFFWAKHIKKLSNRSSEAYNLICKIGNGLNDIVFNLPNEEIKAIFYQVSKFVFQLMERLGNLMSKNDKHPIFSSTNSLCSSSSSNSSNVSNISNLSSSTINSKSTTQSTSTKDGTNSTNSSGVNLAINITEQATKSIKSGKGTLKSGLVGLGFSLALAVGKDLIDRVKHDKKKDILDLSSLDIADIAPNMKGFEQIVNKQFCIAWMVYGKILYNYRLEVAKRLEMEEDENSESYLLWKELQDTVDKLREDSIASHDFVCRCYQKV